MEQWRNLIHINRNFQKAVNLQLDIGNHGRIENYIPTRSSMLILNRYLRAVMGEAKEHATVLIGPYGKGKSHLLLVLLSILSGDLPQTVFDKIQVTDKETADLVTKIKQENKKYLPVLISSIPGFSMNQILLFALREALEKNNLSDIAPETAFTEALKILEKWEVEYPDVYEKFCEHLRENQTDEKNLKKELKRKNKQSLELFKNVYPMLTAGSTFLPLMQSEAVRSYQQITRILTEECGYAGIFIIFDEFSKYIEGHDKTGFAEDMKTLQDMCELAEGSDQKLFFTMVAHKSIHEYTRSIDISMKNAFRGVEGRISEISFVISAQNNYELIANSIQKEEPVFSKQYEKEIMENEQGKFLELSYQLPCFQKLFSKQDFDQIVAKGCFPLTPLAAYALLHISERVAQNERTIFTFLADDGQGSLSWLLERNKEVWVGIDKIYDYFKPMFRETEDAPMIRSEWLKAEYALGKAESEEEKEVIKAIAVIRMLHREDELPAQDSAIWLSLGMQQKKYYPAMERLKKDGVLMFRSSVGVYAFRSNAGVDMEKEIAKKVNELNGHCNFCKILSEVADVEYEVPKQYNQEYAMTRYFQYEYMFQEDFISLESTKYLYDEKFSDGKIIVIIDKNKIQTDKIQKQLDKLADKRVLVLVSDRNFDKEELLLRYQAVMMLKGDKRFIEENEILIQELELCAEDIRFEINIYLEDYYLPEGRKVTTFQAGKEKRKCKTAAEFNQILSTVCKEYYGYAPRVNHELLNIEHIGKQYLRARNQVIDKLLRHGDLSAYQKGTMPEAMVYRAAFVHTRADEGCRKVDSEIENFFSECAGEKRSFQMLYQRLQGEKFGARRGIIPLFLAKKLSEIEGTAVIYIGEKELEITSENLNHVNDFPENYALYLETETVEKEKYLKEIEAIFACNEENFDGQSRFIQIVGSMQKWYRSLPQYTMITLNLPDKQCTAIKKLRNLLRRAEINPRELLFEKIPACYGNTDFEKTVQNLAESKRILDNVFSELKKQIAKDIKKVFGKEQSVSLKACLHEWYLAQNNIPKAHVLTTAESKFFNYLEKLETNDEGEIVSALTYILTGVYLEDWNDSNTLEFQDNLYTVKSKIEKIRKCDKDAEGSSRILLTDQNGNAIEKYYNADISDTTSLYLKNMLEEALEDFGNTLETNQKVAVLVQTLEGLLQ